MSACCDGTVSSFAYGWTEHELVERNMTMLNGTWWFKGRLIIYISGGGAGVFTPYGLVDL